MYDEPEEAATPVALTGMEETAVAHEALWRMTATDLAAAIGGRHVTAVQVITAHLDRIARVNPLVNAVTVVFNDRSLELAEAVDAALAEGRDPGPLAGVPFTVKENIDLTWSPTTHAARFLAQAVSPTNATLVQRLLDAGAIPIARGNMPDFGLRWDTDNDLFGRTLNPWQPDRTPGGSSAGDAVAVATGMTPIGLGNDYGGSLRLPGFAAGVCALRPTAGRVPAPTTQAAPVSLSLQNFAVNGVLARSVDDLDTVFSIIHGADDYDPLSVTVAHPSGYEGPKRAALTRDPLGWGVDDAVDEGLTRAAEALTAAGWRVTEVEPPLIERAAVLWRSISSTEMRASFAPGALPMPLSDGSVTYFDNNVAGAELLDTVDAYADAWAERMLIAAAWRSFQAEYPVILGPVTTRRMPEIGYDLDGVEAADELWRRHRLLVTVNFLGLPSVAVPTGLDDDGVPSGVQLIASTNNEHIALAAARAVESGSAAITPVEPVQTASAR
ncbi:amidase family protein [Subtercola sp. YIM 133946]|uniref:amidase family protein n=1 Tax=Subtercola sp. YIM 133946 TaxID=3118909 RepID=UPI002F92168C